MKNIIATLIVFVSIFSLPACKRENVPIFNDASSIYFLNTARWSPSVATDSVLISFGYAADNVTDSVVMLPVSVLGKTSPIDRQYKVVAVASGTTAKAGYNYDLPEKPIIRAGLSTDSLAITIHRTPDILYNPLTVTLELEPNDNFKTMLMSDSLDEITGKPVYYTIFKVVMQDGLTQPTGWRQVSFYFGTFSVKKLKLIHTVAGMPLDALATYDVPSQNVPFWGAVTYRYLLDQKAAGTPVLEDDGTPMTLGRGVTN